MADSSSDPPLDDAPEADYDSPWKEAILAYFGPFLALCFPDVDPEIDTRESPRSRNGELQRITGDAELGRRYADLLLEVRTRTGEPLWVLIHIEVQGKADADFNRRMFRYYYRIHEHYPEQRVISLAVITHEASTAHLGVYHDHWGGYGVWFRYRLYSLQAIADATLEAQGADNPFALVALAQKIAHRTRPDAARQAAKRGLIEWLYRYGYGRADILQLLRFIDWMLRLPRVLEEALRTELIEYEAEHNMSYVTSFERIAKAEGKAEGKVEGKVEGKAEGKAEGRAEVLLQLYQAKFGPPPETVERTIWEASPEQIQRWLQRILTATKPDEIFEDL